MIFSVLKPYRYYIGSSGNIRKRWGLHQSKMKSKAHHTPKMQNHANKYGVSDLVFVVLECCDGMTTEQLVQREQCYIDLLLPWFNSRKVAQSGAGLKLSDEARHKISEGNKGKPKSESHKQSLSNAWNKRRLTPDSEETRRKKRVANKGRKVWSEGLTKETDERIKKISEGKKGKTRPIEEREKISNALKGRKHDEEWNKKVGDALRGVKQADWVVEEKRIRVKEWWRKKKEQESLSKNEK